MGKKITTGLINKTDNDMEIREFHGLIPDTNHYIRITAVKAGEYTDIYATNYGGDDNQGGQPSKLLIFCNGTYLKSQSSTEGDFMLAGGEVGLRGQRFINSKTVTIDTVAEDRNVVNYKVTFEPRDASASPTHFQVFSDSVLNHDNGWSVHCNNGSVKLTRKEGITMTLDPLKLFATVVDPVETLLLNVVLKYWPRTFADLKYKDDLGTTICIVNDLMRQAKLCHNRESEVEVDRVKNIVSDLDKSCPAMVEWYRPLFPEIQFPQDARQMAEVDQGKLERFVAYIEPLLRQSPGRSS